MRQGDQGAGVEIWPLPVQEQESQETWLLSIKKQEPEKDPHPPDRDWEAEQLWQRLTAYGQKFLLDYDTKVHFPDKGNGDDTGWCWW